MPEMPMLQYNAMGPLRDKERLKDSIFTFLEMQRRKREQRKAEQKGGGTTGSAIGTGVGTAIGAVVGGPPGAAIGASIGGQVGGGVGEMVSPPGSPYAAAQSAREQQTISSIGQLIPGGMSLASGEGFMAPYRDQDLALYYAGGGGVQGLTNMGAMEMMYPIAPSGRYGMPSQPQYRPGPTAMGWR
jgi:hypothetical protein